MNVATRLTALIAAIACRAGTGSPPSRSAG
jgi:hypothetical protein